MHELSISEEIRDIILAKMKEHGKSSVTHVELVFGELTSVEPQALKTAFTSLLYETPAQKAMIKYIINPLKARCAACAKVFRVKDFNYMCPKCGKGPANVIQGNEMLVKSITME